MTADDVADPERDATFAGLPIGAELPAVELVIPYDMAVRSTAITLDDFPATYDRGFAQSIGLSKPLVLTMALVGLMDRVVTDGISDTVTVVAHGVILERPAYIETTLRVTAVLEERTTIPFASADSRQALVFATAVSESGTSVRCCSGRVTVVLSGAGRPGPAGVR